jgi:hypothetical protein
MVIGREEQNLSLTLPVYTNLSNSEYYIAIDLNSIPEFAIHVFIPSMIRVVMRRLGDTELCAWINRLRVVNKMLFNEYLPRQIIDVYNRHGLMGIQACNVIEEREYPAPIKTFGLGKIQYLNAFFDDKAKVVWSTMLMCKKHGHKLIYITHYVSEYPIIEHAPYEDEEYVYIPLYIFADGSIHVSLSRVGRLLSTTIHDKKSWNYGSVADIIQKSISKHYYKAENPNPDPENIQVWIADLFKDIESDTSIKCQNTSSDQHGVQVKLNNNRTMNLWFCKNKGLLRIKDHHGNDVVNNGSCRNKTVLNLSYAYDEATNVLQYIIHP